MNNAWQVAEILESIANNADPYEILRKQFAQLLGNVREGPKGIYMSQPAPDGKSWAFTFFVPVAEAMRGVGGTADEVVEWLSTGLKEGQEVAIVTWFFDRPHFALKRVVRNEQQLADLHALHERTFELMTERGVLPKN